MRDANSGPNPMPMNRREIIALATASAFSSVWTSSAEAEEDDPMAETTSQYDTVVVGGGPAGLSAALVLGRARRKTLVCDDSHGRNAPAKGVHGFFSQDGTSPAELRRIGHEQLKPYDVKFHQGPVIDAQKVAEGFRLKFNRNEEVICRKLILATGVIDDLPTIPDLRDYWGRSVFHCPFCHGWEVKDQPWVYHTPTQLATENAAFFLGWTKKLTLLTHGPSDLSAQERAWLKARHVDVIEEKIEGLKGEKGRLQSVRLEGGQEIPAAAFVVRTALRQRSELPAKLGCQLVKEGPLQGLVQTDLMGATNVDGLYVVGDASSTGVPGVASAVAEGAIAAAAASKALIQQEADGLGP